MVRIALAGGSGGVGREILDALLSTGKHDITIISRKASNSQDYPTNDANKVTREIMFRSYNREYHGWL